MSTIKHPPIQVHLSQHLKRYPLNTFVVACSGGVDSLVLLHEISALVRSEQIVNDVIVCYVDHGLSEHARDWHHFVKGQCQQLDLPFIGKQVSLNKDSNQSLEAQARNARYCVLKEVAGEQGVVITAHHQDDQVETFLLALKRGAGVKGLAAMATDSQLITEHGKLSIVRPLLNVSRDVIEQRAKALDLTWVEDESNLDQQFDRNFLRQTIIPLLNQRWTGIGQAIARSAGHCQDAQLLLDEIARADLAKCLTQNERLSIDSLLTLSSSRFNYVIRYYLAQKHQLMPSSHVLAQIKTQILADHDKTPQVKVGQKWLRRFRNELVLTNDFADVSHWQQAINFNEIINTSVTVRLPDNLGEIIFSLANAHDEDLPSEQNHCLLLPETTDQLTLSFSHKNPVCLPDYRQHSRVLKKVLQELEIPPWQRKRIPLLFVQEHLVSAIGHFVCQPYSVEHQSVSSQRIKINVRWLASDNSG
ncbi:tRNA lysidine(34) synthetase TilS [Thalassotalea piscium]